jgi:hypothetical protein
MATLEQLNAEAARAQQFLINAATGFGAPSVSAVDFGNSTTKAQKGGIAIAPYDFNRALNVSKSPSFPNGVGVSGTVTRFGIDPRLAARGSFKQALSGGSGGGGSNAPNVQISKSDIQPQLEGLLSAIVAAGGTPEAKAASAQRSSATQALNQTVQDLSAANATALAQGVVDDVIRRTLDEVLPQLQASGEGAGASRSALDQLQLNDIAARTAEKAATATVEAITGITGVQAQAGSVVERLTATDPISEQLIRLITGTPGETTQSSGPLDILNALGLLPKDLDPALLQSLINSNTG